MSELLCYYLFCISATKCWYDTIIDFETVTYSRVTNGVAQRRSQQKICVWVDLEGEVPIDFRPSLCIFRLLLQERIHLGVWTLGNPLNTPIESHRFPFNILKSNSSLLLCYYIYHAVFFVLPSHFANVQGVPFLPFHFGYNFWLITRLSNFAK